MLVSRDFKFEAAHRLEDYDGQCEALHGHTWKLRVTLSAPVGEDGLAYDFLKMEKIVNHKVISVLDHSYLNDTIRPPSAERVAQWTWKQLPDLPLHEVRVWETKECSVTYDGTE